jgi:hypothetical protein
VAHVSPATIDRIEHGRVSPTRTIEKILESVDLELRVAASPTSQASLTREDRRSLAFHRIVARHLIDDPTGVRAKATTNLETMGAADPSGRSRRYLDRWAELLGGPDAGLLGVLVDESETARALRQVSPFAGVVTAAERATVYPRRGYQHAN